MSKQQKKYTYLEEVDAFHGYWKVREETLSALGVSRMAAHKIWVDAIMTANKIRRSMDKSENARTHE